MTVFQKFDYSDYLDDGLYWIVFESPKYDFDIGNDGVPVGVPTGELKRRVVLCRIVWNDTGRHDGLPEPYPEFEIVDWSEDSPIEDDEVAVLWAQVEKPVCPVKEDSGSEGE